MFLVILVLLNFGVAWWNSYTVGSSWREARAVGGWGRLVAWSGAIQSACGFTMVFALGGAMIGHSMGYLPDRFMHYVFDLTYLAVILPVLGSGLIITMESWRWFVAKPSLLGGVGTAWNTYAMLSNTYEATSGIGSAMSDLWNMAGGGDNEDNALLRQIAFFAVGVALAGGVLLTYGLIHHYMGRRPMTLWEPSFAA